MIKQMPQVKCSVANCAYWTSGNNCTAELIMIEIDKHANAKLDSEFAGETFDTEHQDYAAAIQETCCHTFKPKH
ncbi:hypothetical protein PRECH8_07270 [Insulibacter thermoxylanivorax]|uniref:DUF1540 domain-containing protein n=2 Tax=Insulibacter thermoxylanivorax TaxID=2749268 RepID=A0A916VFI5_9BACL|nr:hypothetical protein PRECH8_07270 [Insulibacter thermoxylanivorax]